jgi:hypothetical protein
MNYPFDVDEAIRWLGELVDLIFVFFDPIGQVCTFLFFDHEQRSGPKYVVVPSPKTWYHGRRNVWKSGRDTNYPFDVDEAIRWLGELVDLIFVFFDPIGQVCTFFVSLYFDSEQRFGPT